MCGKGRTRGGGRDLLGHGVGIAEGAAVEVVRDAFAAGRVLEGAAVAGDGEEGLEGCFVEVAGWILG